MSLSMRRYQQSPINQSAFLLPNKRPSSRQKNASLNTSSSLSKNPQVDNIRLPSLSSKMSMRKSFSTTFQSDRNTKFKLVTLEDKLDQFKDGLHNTRRQTQESLELCSMLKENLINKELTALNKNLKMEIAGLQGLVNSIKHQNKQRSNYLKDSCNSLWEVTENVKCEVFNLRMKVDQLQGNMGYKQ